MNQETYSQIESCITKHAHLEGALLPILHAVQDELGYVPEESYSVIGKALNLSVAEVHGVVSFYHHFRTNPPGRHILHICRAESCQAMGSEALETHAKALLATDYHGTSDDNSVTLEPIYCLGNCALSPSVMLDEKVYGRVSAAKLDSLIKAAKGA